MDILEEKEAPPVRIHWLDSAGHILTTKCAVRDIPRAVSSIKTKGGEIIGSDHRQEELF